MQWKRFNLPLVAAVVTFTVSVSVSAADAVSKTPIKVYEPGALAPSAYTVIDRLWVSKWRTAFDVPRYPDAESAIRAFLNDAERMGGDGVVNMHCMQSAGVVARWGGHYCYGSVIKLK
jgi:hypothetical protein